MTLTNNNNDKVENILIWIVAVLLGVAGGAIILYATAVAPWAFSDSTIYITAGVNLFHGNGLGSTLADGSFIPLSHYPPMYPILLGLGSMVSAQVIDFARWLDVICFALLIFSGTMLIWKITHSALCATGFGVLLLDSPFIVQQFSGVMSEPFALMSGTIAILLLVLYQRNHQKKWLYLAALLAALSVLTRYLQIVVILSGCIILLASNTTTLKKRLLDSFLFGAISSIPLAGWLISIFLKSHTLGARTISLLNFKTITISVLNNIYNVIKFWFPYKSNLIHGINAETGRILLIGLFLGISVFGFVRLIQRERKNFSQVPEVKLLIAGAIFVIVDLAFLWFASLLTRPAPEIDERMLTSLLPFVFILIFALVGIFIKSLRPSQWPKIATLLVVILFLVNFYPVLKGNLINLHGFGDGFTALIWKNDPLIWKLKEIAQTRAIISNSEAVVQFNTSQAPYRVFESGEEANKSATKQYGGGASVAQTVFRDQCAALVIFRPDLISHYDAASNILFPPEAQQVTDGLPVLIETSLGSIFIHPGCEAQYQSQ